jgi:hypothetical protein
MSVTLILTAQKSSPFIAFKLNLARFGVVDKQPKLLEFRLPVTLLKGPWLPEHIA